MRIRPFLLLLAVLGFVRISQAQTTVTGHVVGANTNPTANQAFIRFRLQNFAGNIPRLNGSGACAAGAVLPFVINVTPNGSGAISQVICGNDVITPQTCGVGGTSPCTFYTVEYWYQGTVQYAWNFSIIGTSFNLDVAIPLASTPPPAPPPIAGGGGSCGTLAVDQILFGTSPATCAVSPQFTYSPSTNQMNLISSTLGAGSVDAGVNLGGDDSTSYAILYDRRGGPVPIGLNFWYNSGGSKLLASLSTTGIFALNVYQSNADPGAWTFDPTPTPADGATETLTENTPASSNVTAYLQRSSFARSVDNYDFQDGTGAKPFRMLGTGAIVINPETVGPINANSLLTGGTLYAAGDTGTFLVNNTGINATYTVNTVTAGGVVATYTVSANGTGYTAGTVAGVDGGAQPGVGTGFSITIASISSPTTPVGMTSNIFNAASYQTNGLPPYVYLDQNFTTSSATLVAITGSANNLAWTFPANTAMNLPFYCQLQYSSNSSAEAVEFGYQNASVAATNYVISGHAQYVTGSPSTIVETSGHGSGNTSATAVISATPGATSTTYVVTISGFIEQPSNAATSLFSIMADIAGSETVTIYRDSYCRLN